MSADLFIINFLYSFFATVLGGVFLALLFFLLREKVFPTPAVTGRWYFEMQTVSTSYNPYKDMTLRYEAMLWCEGKCIKGTVEKIYENSSTGERSYVGTNRTRETVHGFIEKNYFSKDKVVLHVVEDGHGRESTNFYSLIVISNKKMRGDFSSMVAGQAGKVLWQREVF